MISDYKQDLFQIASIPFQTFTWQDQSRATAQVARIIFYTVVQLENSLLKEDMKNRFKDQPARKNINSIYCLFSCWVFPLAFLLATQSKIFSQSVTTRPAFLVDFPMPTADKPQSKLWYMENSWWALLPRRSGPSLWQRTDNGWKEHTDITLALTGCAAKADVWQDKNYVTAVGVSDSTLTVFRLLKKTNQGKITWIAKILARLQPPASSMTMETATIARDKTGRWWVASVAADQVCIWSASGPGKKWTSPIIIAKGIYKDDICAITPLKNGVAVIWSDQIQDAVIIRQHQSGHRVTNWQKQQIIQQGNHTADDHIKTALSDQGTLWVATKNSLDQLEKPQLVLRVRSKNGYWSNLSYANLEAKKMPTRPSVFTVQQDAIVLSGYGDNYTKGGSPFHSQIIFGLVDTTKEEILTRPQIVIEPAPEYQDGTIQNITGPRNPFPKEAPWIILASDQKGRVYEADLRRWFRPVKAR